MTTSTSTTETKITKADQVKTAIMATLNSQESATREELHTACSKISSARTITRALASLKLDGKIQQIKIENSFSWISNESPEKEKAETNSEKTRRLLQEQEKGASKIAKEKKAKKADEKPTATDAGKEFLKDAGLKIVETKADDKLDPKDGKFFGFNHNDTLLGAYLTEKEAKTDLAIYTKETGNSARMIKLDQLTDIECIKLGIEPPKTTPTKAPAKKKIITKDNLIDAGKMGVKRNPPESKKSTPPAKEKKFTQTSLIRDAILGKKTAEQIIESLVKNFGKDTKWAKARFATYEKAYGKMGTTDPAMNKK